MKKIVLYFDPTVQKMLTEKVTEDGEKKVVLSSPHNFVFASEIVARVITIDSEEQIPTRLDPGYDYYNIIDFQTIKADTGIYYDEQNQCYKASAYGFVVFDGQKIKWLSPLTVSRDKSKAYYAIHPGKSGKLPSYHDIEEALHGYKIIARIEQQKIEEQLKAIELDHPHFTRVQVAQGKEPVHGHEEYFLPLINLKKRAGEIKSDGSIDFKEVGSIIEVKHSQDILKRFPAVKPSGRVRRIRGKDNR